MAQTISTSDLLYLLSILLTRFAITIGCGVLLYKKKVCTAQTRKTAIKICEHFFVPCLVFANFILDLNLSQLSTWLVPLSLSVLLNLLSIVIASYLNKIFIKDESNNAFILITSSFSLIFEIPLNLIATNGDLLLLLNPATMNNEEAVLDATRYLLIHALTSTLMGQIIGNRLLTAQASIASSQDTSIVNNSNQSPAEPKSLMSPAIAVALLSIIICLISPVQTLFNGEESIVRKIFTDSTIMCSKALAPMMLIFLGVGLMENGESDENVIASSTLSKINIVKLIVQPILALCLIFIFSLLGLMSDPLIGYAIFVSAVSPSAISLGWDLLRKNSEKIMSKMTLNQYKFCAISIPVCLYLYFQSYL